MNGQSDTKIVWAPQTGPQKALIDCPLPEIFYGGARGGGKTDGVLGKYAIKAETYGKAFNAVFFRRELPMADDAIERSQEIFGPLGWKYNASKYQWRSPVGARLRFRPLERLSDAEKYQGQNLTDATVEEAGNFPDSRPIDRLNGVLRSARGVPTQLMLTGNPGGPGQQWIKKRYIDPCPTGMRVLYRELPNGKRHKHVFIPSKVQNNRALLDADPEYINRLYLVGSEELVKAWLEGDWSAVEGAFFDCWDTQKHVIKPFPIPEHWYKFISGDWGFAAPFSFGWWAVATDDYETEQGIIPRGAMVRYREWYGASEPNIGLRIPAEVVGQGLLEKSDEELGIGVLDPSMFSTQSGPSLAEKLADGAQDKKRHLTFRPGDNRRIGVRGAMGGWDQMRARLLGDERPMIYCFSTCADSIRTIPSLQHDPDKAEDLDTQAEDHAADEWRYACMSRPYIRPHPDKPGPVWDYVSHDGSNIVGNIPIRELIKRKERARNE